MINKKQFDTIWMNMSMTKASGYVQMFFSDMIKPLYSATLHDGNQIEMKAAGSNARLLN